MAVVQSKALLLREYDLIADWYWTDRGRTVGVAEALAVAATPSYQTLVAEHGFVLVGVHDDPGVSTYFHARKSL